MGNFVETMRENFEVARIRYHIRMAAKNNEKLCEIIKEGDEIIEEIKYHNSQAHKHLNKLAKTWGLEIKKDIKEEKDVEEEKDIEEEYSIKLIFEEPNGNRHVINADDFDAFDDAFSHDDWHLVFE